MSILNIKIPFTDRTFNISIPKSNNPMNDSYYDGSYVNIFDTDGKKNSTEQLKAYQGWVGDCVSLIAERVASIPLRLYSQDGELIEKHIFYDLLQKWNPYTTKFEGKELLQIYLDLTGECYIYMVRNGLGIPQELYFRSPDRIKPIIKDGIIDHYIETDGMKETRYEANDILFFKYPNPTSQFRGASPVQRKAYAYDTDKYNMIYQLNTFKNGVHLKQILEAEKMMNPEQVGKILTQFNQTYGGIEKSNGVGALIGGMKLKPVGVSNKDMEYMLLAEWNMRQLASAYHTPPQKLSHPESTNLANMTALDTSWNRECILPRLTRQEEVLNTFLLPMYKDNGLYCKYDNPVPVDNDFKLKQRESNLKNFVISINEARADDGLDPAEWGEKPLAPFSIAPLDVNKVVVEPEPEPAKAIISKEYTEDYKRKYWNNFIKRITPLENNFKRAMIKYFQVQEIEALRALRKNKSISKDVTDALKIPKSKKELEALAELSIPRITEIVKINGTAAYAELGVGGAFDVLNPEVIKFIKKRAGLLIKSIGDTTLEKLKKTLAGGVDAGESIPKLADRISGVFTEAKGYRSTLIARTETIAASNSGALEAYKQSGVVKIKIWLSTMDDRVRDEHAAMDGEEAKINEPFSNGVMAPSEPNCRCSILPKIED